MGVIVVAGWRLIAGIVGSCGGIDKSSVRLLAMTFKLPPSIHNRLIMYYILRPIICKTAVAEKVVCHKYGWQSLTAVLRAKSNGFLHK